MEIRWDDNNEQLASEAGLGMAAFWEDLPPWRPSDFEDYLDGFKCEIGIGCQQAGTDFEPSLKFKVRKCPPQHDTQEEQASRWEHLTAVSGHSCPKPDVLTLGHGQGRGSCCFSLCSPHKAREASIEPTDTPGTRPATLRLQIQSLWGRRHAPPKSQPVY